MIKRLCTIVGVVTLIFFLLFIDIAAIQACNSVNHIRMDETESICRLFAERLNSAAFDNNELRSYLSRSAFTSSTVIHLYDSDGNILYASRAQNDAIHEDEFPTRESVTVKRKHDTYNSDWIYVYLKLDDGTILRVSCTAETVSSVLGTGIVIYPLIAIILSVGISMTMLYYYRRVHEPMQSMVNVLEDFTEGYFDSRIPQTATVAFEDINHFNDVLARLQDRVFRQTTRNNALSAVMNSMETGMLAVDSDLRVLIITPTAKRLLGITGNAEMMPIAQASHDVDLVPIFQEAMQQEGVYTNSVAARTAVGRGKRPLKLYVSPMRHDGHNEGAVAMIEDVTELRRLEQVRNDFVANVSHELKTPLTSIKGFVETLQAGAINKPEMANRFLNIINLETDRLTRLINDILSISKLESGQENLPTEPCDLKRMAEDTCDMLRLHASQKDVSIRMHAGDEDCYVLANKDRIQQMLINIIENAIKYNKDGGIVTVSVHATDETVNFTCADTGIGISEEHIPRLFERFYRVDKGRSRKMGGTGLGLAIVKHIVNSMNGMIEVHSKFGEGTEFLITLPRTKPNAHEQNSVHDDPFND